MKYLSNNETAKLTVSSGGLEIPANNYTIATPPIKFVYPDMSDGESSKGAIIEWGGTMSSGVSYVFGIATRSYKNSPGSTFTVPTSGYKKWAWITTHYDSPASTGEDVHQHLNLETVKADWVTAITRFQISFGEDIALVSFPNSDVKIYPDTVLQIGSDAAGATIKHDTALARMVVDGNTAWNLTGTGGVRIGGTGAPAGRLHVERSDDANVLVLRNTLGSANGAAMLLMENGTAGATALQSGLSGEGTRRYSMNTSGRMEWGSGSGARDTNLYRSAADTLKTDDNFIVGAPGSASGSAVTVDGTQTLTNKTLTTPVIASITNTGTLTLPTSTDTLIGRATTDTLTNKRITPRVGTTTSSATPTINTDSVEMYGLTAQTVDITSFTTNLSGTPVNGQKLWIYIVGTASRAITWGASFEASTVALPTTTSGTNRLDVGFIWNAASSKWRCVAVA